MSRTKQVILGFGPTGAGMVERAQQYTIGVVERDTGIGRDTLRIWERRYGFPSPARNDQGERVYDEAQLRRLQRIRRLLDQGLRPGKLLALDDQALDALEAGLAGSKTAPDENATPLLEAIYLADSARLERLLEERYQAQGMRGFILQTVSPLLHAVGEEWAQGRLQVYQEHFVSVVVSTFINSRLGALPRPEQESPILLVTLPGERHTLGLLMVYAMLVVGGMNVVNLGGEMPMDQLVRAVERFGAGAVGLSFSGAYPYKHIRPDLRELRRLLPDDVAIWVGGRGVRELRKLPEGVCRFKCLEELADGQ